MGKKKARRTGGGGKYNIFPRLQVGFSLIICWIEMFNEYAADLGGRLYWIVEYMGIQTVSEGRGVYVQVRSRV